MAREGGGGTFIRSAGASPHAPLPNLPGILPLQSNEVLRDCDRALPRGWLAEHLGALRLRPEQRFRSEHANGDVGAIGMALLITTVAGDWQLTPGRAQLGANYRTQSVSL